MTDDKYGEEPHKLHRSDDMDTATAAAHSVDNRKWEKEVHEHIQAAGMTGASQRDLERILGAENNKSISPRFAPLRRKGLIFDSGLRRDGCAVWMDSIYRIVWTLQASPEAQARMARDRAKVALSSPKLREKVTDFVSRSCGVRCDCMLENAGTCLYKEITETDA